MIEANGENYEKYLNHQCQNHEMLLIKAQTSLGKTTAYAESIINAKKTKVIIAVPTNRLKNQVYIDLRKAGVEDVKQTPELKEIHDKKIRDEVNYLMEIGAFKTRKEFLENSIKTLKDKKEKAKDDKKIKEIDEDIENISFYLEENEVINHYEGNIVTTWARLFNLHWCLVHTHTLIIDEDILRECIKTKTFNMKKLKRTCKCLKKVYHKELKEKLKIILTAPYKKMKTVKPIYKNGMSEKVVEMIEKEITQSKEDIYNIFDVLSISAFYKYNTDKEKMNDVEYNDDDDVHCLICREFPRMNTIILSATLEKEFYEKYFEFRDIEYIEIPHDKYKGKLFQDCTYSYSRTCLENAPQILEEIRKKYYKHPVITFKKLCKDGEFNFGAVEGLNLLKGKDIIIVGLPYVNDIVYKFFLYRLYGEIITEEKPRYRRIENDMYSFKITTYSNKNYQKIINYFLKSEIEQAVGRARLLRNDCTVHLFSGFPAEQAEMIQDINIKVNNDDEEEIEAKNSDETITDEKDL